MQFPRLLSCSLGKIFMQVYNVRKKKIQFESIKAVKNEKKQGSRIKRKSKMTKCGLRRRGGREGIRKYRLHLTRISNKIGRRYNLKHQRFKEEVELELKVVRIVAVEAIEKVTQVEQEEKRRKEAAAAENKQRLQNAQRDAQRLLEQARAQAEAENRQVLAKAEAEAAQEAQQLMAQAGQACEEMKENARRRLDQAAQLIVEKVVNR